MVRQVAEPAVHVEPVARNPADLRIDLVEVRVVVGPGEVVVRIARQLRQRQERVDVPGDRVDAVRRNEVAGRKGRIGGRKTGSQVRAVAVSERYTTRAVRRARRRIIDRRSACRKIAGAKRRGRQREELRGRAVRLRRVRPADGLLDRGLDAQEVEQLVVLDRATERPAEHALVVFRFRLAGGQEEVPRTQLLGQEVLERDAVQRVGAALDLHVHRRAARHPLLGVEAARHHVDRFNRLNARGVGLQPLNPLVGRADAVETEDGVRVGRAVDRAPASSAPGC